jgi:hypothetical protein
MATMLKLPKIGPFAVLTVVVVVISLLLIIPERGKKEVLEQPKVKEQPSGKSLEGKQDSELREGKIVGESGGERIAQIPDVRQTGRTKPTDKDREHADLIQSELESALNGDINHAWTVLQYTQYCSSAAGSQDPIRQVIMHFKDFHDSHPDVPLPQIKNAFMPIQEQQMSFDDWADRVMRQYEECRSTRYLFDKDLRARIKSQAKSGDVVARFMYALWPPPKLGEPEVVRAWEEYTELAYDFTSQNISEREPLGLLARGISYYSRELFSPQNTVLGEAYLLAAEICGIPNSILDELAMPLAQLSANRAQATASAIAEEFCN